MKFGFKLIEHGLAVPVAGHLLSVAKKGVFHFIILGILVTLVHFRHFLFIWSKGRARAHFAGVWLL
jgi:hypothetical protein